MITTKNILIKGLVLLLKVSSMGIKFLFFSILLPKEMTVAAYGDVGLLIATVAFFIFIVGFDFYNYAHRDFINDNNETIASKLSNQFVFNSFLFVISIPLFYGAMIFNNLPFFEISLLLLFTEYFGQELYRLLIVFSKPILANFILFFRSSLWILALLLMNSYINVEISLFSILLYWIIGNSILFASTVIYSFNHRSFNRKEIKINKKWICKGLAISLPFFISTISLKIIELSDRYIINFFYSKVEVGVYSFYSNISNSLNVFISTSVVIMIYPKILKAFKNKERSKSNKLLKVYKKEMIGFLAFFTLLIIFLINPILEWVNKEEYGIHINSFWVLLIANILFNLSLIPQIILYATHRDKQLIYPVVWAALLNISSNFVLIPYLGIMGAAISTLLSFLVILIVRFYYTKKINFFS